MSFTDDQINKLIENHLKGKEYRKQYYRNRYQTDEAYREIQKQRSKNYYHLVKKKNTKIIQGDYLLAKKRYDYAKRNNIIDKFINKYPDDYDRWFKEGHLQDTNQPQM